MKKLLSLALACLLLFSLSACGREPKEEVRLKSSKTL